MHFNLFKRNLIECPRCLGKGEVDYDDIKRLKKELKWAPGPCAYCQGKGKISKSQLGRIDADNTYLSENLHWLEKKRLLRGDYNAFLRSKQFEKDIDLQIRQIEYLHFEGNLDPEKIADYLLIPEPLPEQEHPPREELIEYIKGVIAAKTPNND